MATRSTIAIKNDDGSVTGVYSHWDGYPEHNGEILVEEYQTAESVRELLSHGNISSLHRACGKPDGHTFDSPVDGFTVYYGRDRGEAGQEAKTYQSYATFLRYQSQQYNYLFEGGEWYVTTRDGKTCLVKDLL